MYVCLFFSFQLQAKLGTSHNPSIQFLQNGQGFLSFPSGGNNVQKFNFSITDIDTGSIECIQQAQGQLQNMGHIPHKMRIHANDDVYETTRHRLAAAEENQKNKWYVKFSFSLNIKLNLGINANTAHVLRRINVVNFVFITLQPRQMVFMLKEYGFCFV